MNYLVKSWAFLAIIVFSPFEQVRAQEAASYKPADKAEILECIKAIAENRSKFDSFGCFMEWDRQEVTAPAGNGLRTFKAAIFESASAERCRWEVNRNGYMGIQGAEIDSFSLYKNGKSAWLYSGDVTRVAPVDVSNIKLAHLESVPDPWMVPLISIRMIETPRTNHKNYWKELLADENLLWAEEDGLHIRGEWNLGNGVGQSRIQVYFSKELGRMPVKVRFIRPEDKTKPFADFGLSFVNENEIKWEKLRGGYVPTEVRSNRKEWRDSDRNPRSIINQTTQFSWDTSLLSQDGSIDADVFVVGKLSFKKLQSSFQKVAVDR